MGNLTHTVGGDIASFRSAARVPIESLKCHFLPVQSGSGDASPDNIRSISGWNNVEIYKSKKNLYANGDQTITTDKPYVYKQLVNPLSPGTYTFSAIITSTDIDSNVSSVRFFGDDGSNPHTAGPDIAWLKIARSVNNSRVSLVFNLDRTASWIYLYAAESYPKGVNDTADFKDIMIEAVNATNEYEEYQGQTYTMNWANNIYCGYVDLITGQLVETHKLLTITGDESNLSNVWDALLIPVPDSVSSNSENIVIACSHTNHCTLGTYIWSSSRSLDSNSSSYYDVCVSGSSGSQIRFRKRDLDPDFTKDIELYKTWLRQQNANGTPLQIVYKLTNPVTYYLTPQQLKTFLNYNNIWSNTNDITEVTYAIHDAASIRAAKKRIIAASPRIENVASGNTSDSTQMAHFITDLAAPFKSCRIDFKPLQWGIGTPAPDNVRTIKGWNSIPIHVAGRNLLEHDLSGSGTFVRTSFTNNSDGSITLTRNSTGGAHIGINNMSDSSRVLMQQNWMKKALPAGTYKNYMTTSSGSLATADALGYLLQPQCVYDNVYSTEHPTSTNISAYNAGTGNITYTIPEDVVYTWYRIYSGGSTYPTGTVTLYPAIFLNSETDTSYEKFSGYTLEINLPATIYGGYIDLIKGELVATMGKYTIDENTPFYPSTNNPTSWIRIGLDLITGLPAIKSRNQNGINQGELCDKIEVIYSGTDRPRTKPTTMLGTYENNKFYNNIYIYDMDTYNTSLTTSTDLENYLRELAPTFIYPIEPITFSLTPQTLNTLRGINNVWSDAGTVSLSYWTH